MGASNWTFQRQSTYNNTYQPMMHKKGWNTLSREDYEMIKRMNELQKKSSQRRYGENDELIIEENTIYEIDLECYECMLKEKSKYINKGQKK